MISYSHKLKQVVCFNVPPPPHPTLSSSDPLSSQPSLFFFFSLSVPLLFSLILPLQLIQHQHPAFILLKILGTLLTILSIYIYIHLHIYNLSHPGLTRERCIRFLFELNRVLVYNLTLDLQNFLLHFFGWNANADKRVAKRKNTICLIRQIVIESLSSLG